VKKLNFNIPLWGKKIGKIAVFGAGKSGIAVARKLGKDRVFLTEAKKDIDPKALRSLKVLKVPSS
jgi:UDP-N-acetylmuramoylalanine-D-glutamate ligase